MTNDEIRARYPYLIEGLMWVACLSEGEATACIRDYRAGFEYSSEAVNHFGGATFCLRAAARQRTRHHLFNVRAWQRDLQMDTTYQPADYRSLGG